MVTQQAGGRTGIPVRPLPGQAQKLSPRLQPRKLSGALDSLNAQRVSQEASTSSVSASARLVVLEGESG